MLLTDVWMLDEFFAQHPPVDLLVAAYLGFKSPGRDGKVSTQQARRANSEVLAALPPRKNVRKLADMPAFLRTPDHLAMIEKMKADFHG
jgi:hypothetical protein